MTRQPETPIQKESRARHYLLVQYLLKLSEERQVMFIKNLLNNKLKLDVIKDLNRLKETRGNLVPPKDITKYQVK